VLEQSSSAQAQAAGAEVQRIGRGSVRLDGGGGDMNDEKVLDAEVVDEPKLLTERQQYAKHLREVADFFEEHEDVPIPVLHVRFDLFNLPVSAVPQVARAFGSLKKEYIGDSFFVLKRKFGELLSIEANWNREQVCTRVVVGQKTVAEKVPTAYETVNKTVDVVEWRCTDPVLAPKTVTPVLPSGEEL
jgi:hypothetical protein